jgi:hypothetical protein
VDPNLHLIDLSLNGSGIWQKQDLMTAPGATLATRSGTLASIVNVGGCPHVFYIDVSHQFNDIFLANITGGCASTWSYNNLTMLSGTSILALADRPISTIGPSSDALQSQFYVGSGGAIYRLYWPSTGGVFNQTLTTGEDNPNTSGSPLASFVNAGGCLHVFYVDTVFHFRDVFQSNINGGCSSTWSTNDYTVITGASNFVTTASPISPIGPSNEASASEFYVSRNDNHVYRLYWPSSGGVFNQDLTILAGGPLPISKSGLTSIVNAGGCPHVFYVDTNQHVSSLFLANIGGGCASSWSYQDITIASGAGNNAAAGSAITSLGPTVDALQSEFYVGTNQDIFRIFWQTTGVNNQDVTLLLP